MLLQIFARGGSVQPCVAGHTQRLAPYDGNPPAINENIEQHKTLDLLGRASSRADVSQEEIDSLSGDRRRLVQTISRVSRATNFREKVLRAYGYRCAITRVQLGLVEAAHILPVAAPESVDDVRNGIALSPTYHRAFDSGLIYMDIDYSMKINRRKVGQLRALASTGGLTEFESFLGPIHLPPDDRQRPHIGLIKKAIRYRGIAEVQ